MRKNIGFLILLVSYSSIAIAQFSGKNCVQATKLGYSLNLMDEFFACYGASPSPEITYTYTTPATFKWYKYTTSISAKTLIQTDNNVTSSTLNNPDLNCGYVLEVDGKTKYCWLADLLDSKNIMRMDEVPPTVSKGSSPCTSVDVAVVFKPLRKLTYISSSGSSIELPRKMTVKYSTLEWNESASSYNTKEVLEEVDVYGSEQDSISRTLSVPSPLCKTTFAVSGDAFITALSKTTTVVTSFEFTPVAIEAHLSGSVTEREYKNEKDRSSSDKLGGSAPLNIEFKSNSNYPICQFFEWYVINKTNRADQIYYTDIDLHYVFKNSGTYTVKLVASNAECKTSDSISVSVLASDLQVPNVFTPNSDGKNDEFRVAYKSLIKYSCVVYNRWGREVFRSSDPGKGWDGRINGKMANPGPYYYIIDAEGSDVNSDTNRTVKYKKKGDINLLRGKD